MDTFLTKTSGALPDNLNNLKATEVGPFAKVAVDRNSRALLTRSYGSTDRPNTAATGGQTATVTNVAQTLAEMGVSLHAATQTVLISVEGADIRFDPAGGTPTATVGQPVYDGDPIEIGRAEALAGKFIRQAGDNATLQISEYL